ncbi:beta-carotene ketolase (CrtW type) [Pontibacter aydingkolensis]|uniref:Fatty acid desaturase n=1 Tax=Pontibacter aydingkolensis TaxID=1911536 RepID=A0ABS7CWN3_9BACT|nr:fatty acid desaturase [Pontibacter aydingkolensis]MBW7468106.1 fatty acid desaturase [Pontibacter aydingkolensis]
MAISRQNDRRGIVIAAVIVICWTGLLLYLLTSFEVSFASPLTYLFILLQTHLYTGLFITAHDAMHAVVAPGKPKLNKAIGTVTAFLFAYNWYARLLPKHHQHHRHVATEQDPDYHRGSFWPWYFSFLKNYITWWQIVLMAITYNVLQLFFSLENVVLFWMLPAILATFQLFYFGTYLPHRGEHPEDNPHKSTTQSKNHVWAFISCYFFGYHYEHHDKPYLPWWQLYKAKG